MKKLLAIGLVFAMLLGMLFYREYPSVDTLIGTGLIILGVYLNVTWKNKTKER